MPFKRGDVVEFVDGSIYVLVRQPWAGAWLVGTIVECSPGWTENHEETVVDESDIKLLTPAEST